MSDPTAGPTWEVNAATGCFVWKGKRGRGDRPVITEQGQQRPASRSMWQRVFGPLRGPIQLIRVCPPIDCVSPYHHVIRSPGPVLQRLGASAKLAALVRQMLLVRQERDPAYPVVWKGTAWLQIDPLEVASLAATLETDPLVIHCAYAQLVGRAKRDDPDPNDDAAARAERDRRSIERATGALIDLGVPMLGDL